MLADRRRVLIAVNKTHEGEMKSLFEREALAAWQPLFADSFSRARFTLQHNPCEALIVHEDLMEAEGSQGLAWLAWKKNYPTLFVGQSAAHFQRAYELGVQNCLLYPMTLAHPPLLATVLEESRKGLESSLALSRTKEHLTQTRRHLDRLVTMMWRAAPHTEDSQWYSEPFMLERLQEELARSERHKLPLSLAIGEMKDDGAEAILPEWTPETVIKTKRRCDVVGHYGPGGFMLLMVQTPKPGSITCCQRLQSSLEESAQTLPGPRPAVRAYFGLASTAGDRASPQALLRSAEQNLDAARRDKAMRLVAD
jgi:hypothetical protein